MINIINIGGESCLRMFERPVNLAKKKLMHWQHFSYTTVDATRETIIANSFTKLFTSTEHSLVLC